MTVGDLRRYDMETGPGEENVDFDDGIAAEEEEGNQNVDQAESSTAIYANTQQATHGVTTGDLVSYVEDKRRHNGFEKEFAVSCSEDAPFLSVQY